MATIQKRGDKYRVQIRKQGQKPLTQTFTTRKDALAWAKKVESEIERGIFLDTTEAQQTTLSEALDRYGQEVSPSKRGCYKELSRIKRLKADLGNLSLSIISSKFIASYRDTRLQIADSQTVRRELALLSHVLNVCIKDWGINLPHGNSVQRVRMPKLPQGRERRLEVGELDRLLAALKDTPTVKAIVQFALETTMRR